MRALALGIVLVALTGCSSTVPEATPTPSVTWPTPNPEDNPVPPEEDWEGPYCCSVIMPGSGLIF